MALLKTSFYKAGDRFPVDCLVHFNVQHFSDCCLAESELDHVGW